MSTLKIIKKDQLKKDVLERTSCHMDNRYFTFLDGVMSGEAKKFHQQGMFTEIEVLTMLEDYGDHYRCHISQYCDQNEIMEPEEFFKPYKTEKYE